MISLVVDKIKRKRGFAVMSEERQREIARKGGINAHKKGKAHKWTPEEAKLAGQKSRKGKKDAN